VTLDVVIHKNGELLSDSQLLLPDSNKKHGGRSFVLGEVARQYSAEIVSLQLDEGTSSALDKLLRRYRQ